ncbi:hypothetical protein [Hymenobacter weizhouensis]|uniref:hypothetical protein n=1 Tax=Hymenobacter sp. YIM 151500-1 TaxID=2987689 RepID=UPI00222702E0|nr:hypothetical protein [Hymenobacter sp. YIM 151500-1]UYZ63708.1 hypothetical protein OIS53_02425 [Hymenobacter sp. YIM 151500-1]
MCRFRQPTTLNPYLLYHILTLQYTMLELLDHLKAGLHWLGNVLFDGLLSDVFDWVAQWLFP